MPASWKTCVPKDNIVYLNNIIPTTINDYSTFENKSIEQIAKIALKACDAEHLKIKWDREKPDGQFRKDASSDKFLNDFPDFEFTSLFEGIQKTYNIKYNECLEIK